MKNILLFSVCVHLLTLSCFADDTDRQQMHPLECTTSEAKTPHLLEEQEQTEQKIVSTLSQTGSLKAEVTESGDSIILYSLKGTKKLSWTAAIQARVNAVREKIGTVSHLEDFDKEAVLPGNGQPISHVEISPNEKLLLASTAHGVLLFDIKSRKQIATFDEKSWKEDAKHELSNAAFIGNNLILSVQQDQDYSYGTTYKVAGFRLWDIATGTKLNYQSITVRNAKATATNISASGKTIIGLENKTVINKVNVHPVKPKDILRGAQTIEEEFFAFEDPVIIEHKGLTAQSVRLSPDGTIATIEYREKPGILYQWNISGKKPVEITEKISRVC